MSNQYDADYFLRGKETGKSLYEDYRWLPNLTIPMVCAMVRHLGIDNDDSILDFGCARGYTVRALREMGYNAWGVDISEWAISNADEKVADYLRVGSARFPLPLLWQAWDWIIAKDVLEHVVCLEDTVAGLMRAATKGVFAVVPLSATDGELYIVEDYEKDVTHLHRLTLSTWAAMFMRAGWAVTACYRVKGVKDNYSQYDCANGFITALRLK